MASSSCFKLRHTALATRSSPDPPRQTLSTRAQDPFRTSSSTPPLASPDAKGTHLANKEETAGLEWLVACVHASYLSLQQHTQAPCPFHESRAKRSCVFWSSPVTVVRIFSRSWAKSSSLAHERSMSASVRLIVTQR